VKRLNIRKKYANQLKPFNFLLTCQVKQFGHPLSVDPERFHLIAPYETDPRRWLEMEWVDIYSGSAYQILTEGFTGSLPFHADASTGRSQYAALEKPEVACINPEKAGDSLDLGRATDS
jgi:hypothetical protein